MARKYDFCGYATRTNVRCSDGRIIMHDAFKDDDGRKVPLVWNHQHKGPESLLGHAYLENRDDGVYAYATFNDTDNGQRAKKIVEHGDITALSIYASDLKEQAKHVMHGIIREVSLVLAGANPKASIDSYITHSDGTVSEDRSQGWFYSGMDGELYHSDESEDQYDEDEEDGLFFEHSEDGGESDSDSGDDDSDDSEDEDGEDEDSDDEEDEVDRILKTFTDEQKIVVMAMLDHATGQNKSSKEDEKEDKKTKEDSEMKHNVFDTDEREDNVLSHSDEEKIIAMAKDSSIGTLKGAIRSFCDNSELAHGFDSQSLTLLFPEYKDLKPGAPEMITNDRDWVPKVLNKVHKMPMTRVRTRWADIREAEELRGKGYTKGQKKALSGDISVIYRTTDAQTVYVRSDLDRDDILDITDFDYVDYMYKIDRMSLEQELATAIMLGDGRAPGAQYKIDESKIRNIWNDDELFTIHRTIDLATMRKTLQGTNTSNYFGDNFVYAETFVQELLYGREDAKNVGQGDLFIAPHVLNMMLLARDRNGRRIYSTVEELRSALNVREIITVEQFEGKKRTTSDGTKKLLAMLVNLDNYHLGANKGGEITHFTDFDIDFNKEKSLLETRVSGANTRLFSALVLEEDEAVETPTEP